MIQAPRASGAGQGQSDVGRAVRWGRPPWEAQFQQGRDCKSCTDSGLGPCKGPEVGESVLPEQRGGQRAQSGMSEGIVGEG